MTQRDLAFPPRPSARLGLPHRRQLPKVIRPKPLGSHAAALLAQRDGGLLPLLADEIVRERQRRANQLQGARRSILRQVGAGGQNQFGFGEQVVKSFQFGARGLHTFTVQRFDRISKRSLFSEQRTFQTLPNGRWCFRVALKKTGGRPPSEGKQTSLPFYSRKGARTVGQEFSLPTVVL